MRAARIGSILLAVGAFVGAAAGVGLLLGFEPARLPAALLNVAAYKLTFLASAGLLAAGAIVLRHTHRDKVGGTTSAQQRGDPRQELGAGQPADEPVRGARSREPVRKPPRSG